ncbi:hypothetical protein EYF80_052332 [Liparis tanakae]|uniref:Uncharacterized protein n=1 Tax=Liparis tanakae TaxID=230148 RepID=A0A4Z2F8M1_9TELE|nr:hypothetical protein EYF80_052332 [Liparis tanakae]
MVPSRFPGRIRASRVKDVFIPQRPSSLSYGVGSDTERGDIPRESSVFGHASSPNISSQLLCTYKLIKGVLVVFLPFLLSDQENPSRDDLSQIHRDSDDDPYRTPSLLWVPSHEAGSPSEAASVRPSEPRPPTRLRAPR